MKYFNYFLAIRHNWVYNTTRERSFPKTYFYMLLYFNKKTGGES
jgi:hypothetical protein